MPVIPFQPDYRGMAGNMLQQAGDVVPLFPWADPQEERMKQIMRGHQDAARRAQGVTPPANVTPLMPYPTLPPRWWER